MCRGKLVKLVRIVESEQSIHDCAGYERTTETVQAEHANNFTN